MNYHFIAIGGAVMHNLALELSFNGHQVTGSDDEIFEPAKSRLAAQGLLPEKMGWYPEKITDKIDAIVLGMHARGDNPELLKAKELGVPIYSFPEFIYEQSKLKKRLVIAGSHGKTTSTGMLMHILKTCGVEFDYLVGSLIPGYDRMVRISQAPVVVIEGDEYLTSPLDHRPKFIHYQAHAAMITGIAWDHVNVFPTEAIYQQQFQSLLETMDKENPRFFWFQGDADLEKMAQASVISNESYQAPTYQVAGNGVEVKVGSHTFSMPFFGEHNLQNAAGVVKMAETVGVDALQAWKALETFPGTAKRLEKMVDTDKLTIYRDFAHAPSKVEATVKAVADQYHSSRFLAVFEVHTYSSLNPEFMGRYKNTLNPADDVWILFDPHVFELKKMEVPSAETIELRFGKGKALNDPQQMLAEVKHILHQHAAEHCVLLLMSSGNLGGLQPADFLG